MADLDDGIRLWLYRKGFADPDIEAIETAAGGIVQGLIILIRVLAMRSLARPARLPRNYPEKKIVWDSWTKLNAVDITAVRVLFNEVNDR